jgi:hypothetical protein
MNRQDTCTVFRTVTTLTPPYNTPTNVETTIGTYACHLSGKTGLFAQGQPNAIITTQFKLFLSAGVDIQNGDLILVNNTTKYIAQNVYCPLNKHTEVDLIIKGES